MPNDDRQLVLELLEKARLSRVQDDVRAAMHAGYSAGFDQRHVEALCAITEFARLPEKEDIIFALSHLRDPRAIPTFVAATRLDPINLGYEGDRAMASKAIWGLSKIHTPEAFTELESLTRSDDEDIRRIASEHVERHRQGNAP